MAQANADGRVLSSSSCSQAEPACARAFVGSGACSRAGLGSIKSQDVSGYYSVMTDCKTASKLGGEEGIESDAACKRRGRDRL